MIFWQMFLFCLKLRIYLGSCGWRGDEGFWMQGRDEGCGMRDVERVRPGA